MLDFRVGERVRFCPTGRPTLTGTITRYRKKPGTVITDAGQHSNVAPGLLSKIGESASGSVDRDDIRIVPVFNRPGSSKRRKSAPRTP
jgi:hypothetical protein